jgi:hypothetical protein
MTAEPAIETVALAHGLRAVIVRRDAVSPHPASRSDQVADEPKPTEDPPATPSHFRPRRSQRAIAWNDDFDSPVLRRSARRAL